MGRVRITRPFVLLALAALMARPVEASRTSVWESNPHAALTAARTDAAGLLASPASADVVNVDAAELPAFDLGDVVLVESVLEHEDRLGLGPLDLLGPTPLRGPPSSYPETRVRGFELLPPFRVGASPSLSLWSRQACGFPCLGLTSDGPQDPWGLCAFGLPCPGFIQRGIDAAADGAVAATTAATGGLQQLGRAGSASVNALDRWGRDVARAAKIAVGGKSAGYTSGEKDWAARTYLRSFGEVLALGEVAMAPRGGGAPEGIVAGPARGPNPRHLQQVGDPSELDALLTKLGERAVRHGEALRAGGMAGREAGAAAESVLEKYGTAVNNRLSRYDSPFTIEWQPAILEGTGRVPPFVQSRAGRIFPYPDSLRLDMSLSDTRVLTTTPEVSTDVYPTILRGYDITLDERKVDAAVKYQEAFGVPVTDIRPRR